MGAILPLATFRTPDCRYLPHSSRVSADRTRNQTREKDFIQNTKHDGDSVLASRTVYSREPVYCSAVGDAIRGFSNPLNKMVSVWIFTSNVNIPCEDNSTSGSRESVLFNRANPTLKLCSFSLQRSVVYLLHFESEKFNLVQLEKRNRTDFSSIARRDRVTQGN